MHARSVPVAGLVLVLLGLQRVGDVRRVANDHVQYFRHLAAAAACGSL